MPRCTAVAVIAALALAASAAAAEPTIAGWRFVAKQPHLYKYELASRTELTTAGETLVYTTALTWRFVLAASEVTPERVRLGATILGVQARMDGPGTSHAIDTADRSTHAEQDPLFGHLFALEGAGFSIDLDPRTGAVAAVRGGEAVAAKIAAREPSPFGADEPSPLQAQASAAYSSEALSRLWSQLLAVPAAGETRVPLSAPLSGEIVRRWQGDAYTWQLPAGTDSLAVTVGNGPLAMAGTLTELSGGGSVSERGGVPGGASGELAFTLSLTALTQPTSQRQTLRWTLSPIDR